MRAWLPLVLIAGAAALGGCARDVNDELEEEPYPTEVRLAFRTVGPLAKDVFYYMVFNFSQAPNPPSTAVPTAGVPEPLISDDNRGANWELYVMLHLLEGGAQELVSRQRPRDPSVLPTARGPADCVAGDFTGDGVVDIAVACPVASTVQLIPGNQEFDIYDPIYFLDAVDIPASAGVQPLRLHAADFTADGALDLLVLYAGDAENDSALRLLSSDGAGSFAAVGADFALEGVAREWLVRDLTGDQQLDVAVLSAVDGDAGLRIYLGGFEEDAYTLTASGTLQVGDDAVGLAAGVLEGAGEDLVVGESGTDNDGRVRVLLGDGDGTFQAGPVLSVAGTVAGVAVGQMMGGLDDVVVTFQDADGLGNVGVFHNEEEGQFQEPAQTVSFADQPYYPLVFDTDGDNRQDVFVVNGVPGSQNQTLFIVRGDRQVLEIGGELEFTWDLELIAYLTGLEPSRISLADLDTDGKADDLLIPNSYDGEGGNSINLFHGLGKANYASADVYWTDHAPDLLTAQQWYLRHSVGPNFFELVVDPGLFYDLTQLPPESFIVDFMTGTTAIEFLQNEDQLGEIRDHLSQPVTVPMVVNHFDDEQNSPRALGGGVPIESEDINFWQVEVF